MRTRFITSAADRGGFPERVHPEVAFVGRSNVGKSSLLNVLSNAKIARTSRTPGRTQLVNFFEVYTGEHTYSLADLPGYGYAKVPKSVVQTWAPLVESYFDHREGIGAALLLIDARREVQRDDLSLYDYLSGTVGARGGEVVVVATKIDKLPKSKRKPALNEIGVAFGLPRGTVLGTSASTRDGLEALDERIGTLLFRPSY